MANRSGARISAQQTINAAHVIESLAIRTAEQSDTTESANASLTLSSSAAAADYNYISLAATGLATAAKTYADHMADLAQTKADARAQAQRDLTVNQDMPAYQNALDQADQDYEDDLSGYEQTYKSSAGSGLSTDMKAKATAHLTYADQVVPVSGAAAGCSSPPLCAAGGNSGDRWAASHDFHQHQSRGTVCAALGGRSHLQALAGDPVSVQVVHNGLRSLALTMRGAGAARHDNAQVFCFLGF